MSEQKALILEGVGREFVFKTIEIYKPGPGELLVKIKATGLNPADWKVQKYDLGLLKFPAIVGYDIAGDVVELGDGVKGYTKGDKVFFQGQLINRTGGFQQYAITNEHRAAKIPEGWTYDQVATIPLVLITAWRGMYNKLGLDLTSPASLNDSPKGKYANTPIFISGGPSSVGQMAIQLAKFSGFEPIITTSSLKHEAYLKSLGATHLIDRYIPSSSLASEVGKITTKPIKFAFDAIASPEVAQAGYDLLANGGTICTVYPGLKLKETEGSGKKVTYPNLLPEEEMKAIYNMLTSLLESGAIVPNKLEVLPNGLHGALEGLKRLENDQVSAGKLIIHPDETD